MRKIKRYCNYSLIPAGSYAISASRSGTLIFFFMIHFDIYSQRCDREGKILDFTNDYIDELEISSPMGLNITEGVILEPFEGFPLRRIVKIQQKKF